MPVTIFFCYAHEDEPLLDKLKAQLRPLQRRNIIDVWYDRNISAGTEWEYDIDQHLSSAQIILLLVSPDFMNSDYCYGIEMQRALERHERKEVVVIPIILRHVYWQEEFGKLQVLPTDAKPIIDRYWHSLDEAFFDVVGGIRKAIEKITVLTSVKSVPQQNTQVSSVIEKVDVPTPITVKNIYQEPVNQTNDRDKYDKFTERARKVLSLAQEEAHRFQHNYLGTEHLLLGLVREGEGVAAKVLANLGVELNNVRAAVEFIIGRGDRIVLGKFGFTPRTKKVIELAVDEARRLNHHYIGTEHLLLALIREGEGIAAGVLESLGVNLEKARTQTILVLGRSSLER